MGLDFDASLNVGNYCDYYLCVCAKNENKTLAVWWRWKENSWNSCLKGRQKLSMKREVIVLLIVPWNWKKFWIDDNLLKKKQEIHINHWLEIVINLKGIDFFDETKMKRSFHYCCARNFQKKSQCALFPVKINK